MMKYLVLIGFQIAILAAAAGQSEGIIVYEERMDMHRRLPPERLEEMRNMMPQYNTTKYELYYTEQASKYKAVQQEQPEEVSGSHGGAQFRMRFNAPHREVYKNLEKNEMVDEREFMTKMFLIKGTANPYAWKIAEGQKKILDYPCLQASYKDSVNTIVAWFTPQMPISNGPAEFGGLPGMILQIDFNDGERTLTATEIKSGPVDAELLKEPTKGKEVTQQEFREIMAEKMKEMEQMNGEHGPTVIIHRQ